MGGFGENSQRMFYRLTLISLILSLSLSLAEKPTEFDIPDTHWEPR